MDLLVRFGTLTTCSVEYAAAPVVIRTALAHPSQVALRRDQWMTRRPSGTC